MNSVCFVLARSESVRLPRKNFLDFDGKPLMLTVLDKLLDAKFDKIVVVLSSFVDSGMMSIYGLPHAKHDVALPGSDYEKTLNRISQVKKNSDPIESFNDRYLNVDVVCRPQELAGGDVKPEDIILHFLPQYPDADTVCLAQCTSPLVEVKTYTDMLEKFKQDESDLLFSVNPLLQCNGAMYIIRRGILENDKSFWSVKNNPSTYVCTFKESLDVDTADQFLAAKSVQKYQCHFGGQL